ncbi:hypothetical protein HDU84_003354 [Entophlyctis sp. JEL0112]|nr:hypothetical protein HDU84_003354 [Entophlyctis sp. JEL0112]
MPEHKSPAQYAPHVVQPVFGPYKLVRTVGEGEFGKVKLSIDTRNNEEVAIKLLKKERISSPSRRAKVMREISMMQALDHPYVVSLKEVVETDSYIGLVMEYASGGEMFHYIMAQPDGRLSEPEGRRFFAELVSGEGVCSYKCNSETYNMIRNFGFANKNSEYMETSCGSPGYAAPELVISNVRTCLLVSDFLQACICRVTSELRKLNQTRQYGMLCGYLPYDDDPANPESENINLLYQYILQTRLTYPSHVSPEARGIISLMLVPDPKLRGKMADIMGHEWLAPEADVFKEELNRRMKQFGYSNGAKKSKSTDLSASTTLIDGVDEASPSMDDGSKRSFSMYRQDSTSSKYPTWFRGKKGAGNGVATPVQKISTGTNAVAIDDNAPSAAGVEEPRPSIAYSISNSLNGVLKERTLKMHLNGPVDQKAKTNRDPLDLLIDLETMFEQRFGWVVQSNGASSGEYKLRVLKPRGVKVIGTEESANAADIGRQEKDEALPVDAEVQATGVSDRKLTQIVESLPVSLMKRIKTFVYMLGPNSSKGFDGSIPDPSMASRGITGMEQEMIFTVEIKSLKESTGECVVEFRRTKGDIWGFKRLYASVIDKLPLADDV